MDYSGEDERDGQPPHVGQRQNSAMPYGRIEDGREYVGDERPAYGEGEHMAQPLEPILTDDPYQKRRQYSCGFICCILVIILLVILLLLGIVALVLYLVFKPKAPSVTVTNVSVNNIALSPDPFNISAIQLVEDLATDGAFQLLANASYQLLVENPNKVTLLLESTVFNATYGSFSLTNATLPAFSVGAGKSTLVNSTLLVDLPMSSGLAADVYDAFAANAFNITTKIFARAKISILGIASPTVKVYLTCATTFKIQPRAGVTSNACSVTSVGF